MKQRNQERGKIEQSIQHAERDLYSALGAMVEEEFVELAQTGVQVRVLSHGRGAPVVLLHGVSLSAAVWAPLFTKLPGVRLLAVDLPGHGLSDPVAFRRGRTREHAHQLIDDLMDALALDEAPVIGHSLGC